MRIGSCLFLLGIVTLMQFRELPPLYSSLLLLLSIFCRKFPSLIYLLWYLSGFFWALFCCHSILARGLDPDLEGRKIKVEGYVASLPAPREQSVGFDFVVTALRDEPGITRNSPGKIRLSWYRPYPLILPGQRLSLEVSLKQPHGMMNRHGFDYESWLFQQRIRATGYVRKAVGDPTAEPDRFSLHSIRYQLRERLIAALPDTPGVALVLALTLGDRSRMDDRQWQMLTATGTSHLLAISGLHIGLIAGLAYFLVRRIWPLYNRAAQFVPTPVIASIMSLLAATAYALLAGFTIPTQRALLMISVLILSRLFSRRMATADTLALALLGVLIIDPLAVLSSGFWLSFSAVFIILLALNHDIRHRSAQLFHSWGKVQLFIYIGLTPVLAAWFNQLPLSALAANSIAIPWVSFISVPLVILGTILLMIHETTGTLLLHTGTISLEILQQVLHYLSLAEMLLVTIPQHSAGAVFAAVIGCLLLFMPSPIPGRWLGILWLLPLCMPVIDLPETGEFEVSVLDSGQGLAVVVRTRHRLLLYDTGPGFSSGYNAGRAIIIPYLRSQGLTTIDLIVQSHGDSDHIGGLNTILADMDVQSILSSVPDRIDFPHTARCLGGRRWRWDGIEFEILHPPDAETYRGNDASCVLKVSNDRHSVLIPGDIERRVEQDLLGAGTGSLQSTVLIAPHHGSMTSSTYKFIQAVSPEYVIFSTGYLNRFRLPKQDIINRYHEHGVKTLNTADDGAISLQFNNSGYSFITERDRSLRFWNARP